MKVLVLVLACAMPALGIAGTLSTTTSNNGTGGVFMNLIAGPVPLDITGFDSYFGGTGAANVEVWTRPGSYVGFDASNVGWTLSEVVAATGAATATVAPIPLATPISIGAGQTVAVLLHGTTSGRALRYTGTAASPPVTNWSNADLALFSDVARTGNVPFGGTRFTPRCFAGNVHYNLVPEPASFIAMGLGVAALLRRRRR